MNDEVFEKAVAEADMWKKKYLAANAELKQLREASVALEKLLREMIAHGYKELSRRDRLAREKEGNDGKLQTQARR